jgi:hypothetical protein
VFAFKSAFLYSQTARMPKRYTLETYMNNHKKFSDSGMLINIIQYKFSMYNYHHIKQVNEKIFNYIPVNHNFT